MRYQDNPYQVCFGVEGQAEVVPFVRSEGPEPVIRVLEDERGRPECQDTAFKSRQCLINFS